MEITNNYGCSQVVCLKTYQHETTHPSYVIQLGYYLMTGNINYGLVLIATNCLYNSKIYCLPKL